MCAGVTAITVNLDSADKMYVLFDMYARAHDSTLALITGGTSVGTTSDSAFRMVFKTTSKPVSLASSVPEVVIRACAGSDDIRHDQGKLTMVDSTLIPAKNTWYRFGFEISQSPTPGEGTFSIFA